MLDENIFLDIQSFDHTLESIVRLNIIPLEVFYHKISLIFDLMRTSYSCSIYKNVRTKNLTMAAPIVLLDIFPLTTKLIWYWAPRTSSYVV